MKKKPALLSVALLSLLIYSFYSVPVVKAENRFNFWPTNKSNQFPQLISLCFKNCGVQDSVGSVCPIGPKGDKGDPGIDGKDGAVGLAGIQGLTGPIGPAGRNGIDGKDGTNGKDGTPGIKGDKGEKGDPGSPGSTTGISGYEIVLSEITPDDDGAKDVTATCSSGKKVISGGYNTTNVSKSGEVVIKANYPNTESGWRVMGNVDSSSTASTDTSFSLQAYAICVSL